MPVRDELIATPPLLYITPFYHHTKQPYNSKQWCNAAKWRISKYLT